MGIEAYITSKCNQTAVYWGSPTDSGYGREKTYADPVEIDCRWEDSSQLISDDKGNEITSRAVVFVTQDVDEQGMLYLGTLDTLYDGLESSAGALDDPQAIAGVYTIRRFEKVPSINDPTQFLRKAYLTPSLSFGGF